MKWKQYSDSDQFQFENENKFVKNILSKLNEECEKSFFDAVKNNNFQVLTQECLESVERVIFYFLQGVSPV